MDPPFLQGAWICPSCTSRNETGILPWSQQIITSIECRTCHQLQSVSRHLLTFGWIYVLECPQCAGVLLVREEELQCGIFRHAADAQMNPLPPHASQTECESKTSYGCGKPFRIHYHPGVIRNIISGIEICDYI